MSGQSLHYFSYGYDQIPNEAALEWRVSFSLQFEHTVHQEGKGMVARDSMVAGGSMVARGSMVAGMCSWDSLPYILGELDAECSRKWGPEPTSSNPLPLEVSTSWRSFSLQNSTISWEQTFKHRSHGVDSLSRCLPSSLTTEDKSGVRPRHWGGCCGYHCLDYMLSMALRYPGWWNDKLVRQCGALRGALSRSPTVSMNQFSKWHLLESAGAHRRTEQGREKWRLEGVSRWSILGSSVLFKSFWVFRPAFRTP